MDYYGPNQDPQWQAELDTIAPPGTKLSWLKLVWVPGDPWQQIDRWVIYQMIPYDRANRFVQSDLAGPSPRVRGRWDDVLKKFIPDPDCNIDLIQWQLYQDTGSYGRPYWIVQGSQGGHKRIFNRQESAISKMNGGPMHPPLIGDLPFANPDRRTFDKLVKFDVARRYSYLLNRAETNPAMFEAHDQAILDQMRAQVWNWIESQVSDVVRDNKAGARALQETARETPFNERLLEQRLFT